MDKAVNNLPPVYLKLSLGFLALAILTSFVIIYSTISQAVITIVATGQKINDNFTFEVKNEPGNQAEAVRGKVIRFDLEKTENFAATGSRKVQTDIVGEVTIYNESGKSQTLVEKTRLASATAPDTVLVRIKKAIEVPPGEQVNVQVYAEDVGKFAELQSQKFVIPGLWQPLWDKIYAKNNLPLKVADSIAIVNAGDIEQGTAKLKEQLYQEALAKAGEQLGAEASGWPKLISSKILETKSEPQVGSEASEVTISMKYQVTAVAFDETELVNLVKSRYKNSVQTDKDLIDLDPKSLNYEIKDYNIPAGTAQVSVSYSGQSAISNNSQLLNKSKLVGLTEEEIIAYLSKFIEVKEVRVNLQPPWAKSAPLDENKIIIRLE